MHLLSWITAINVLVASGFSIAGLIAPQSILPSGSVLTDASQIFAMYAAARTIPLALITLILIYKQYSRELLILGILAGIIQMIDAGVGVCQHDLGKSLGPLSLSLLQFYAVFAFLKSSSEKGQTQR
jgi:hypothetical protein